MIELTKKSFNSSISKGIVFVDFWADWCGYCSMLAPILEEFKRAQDGKLRVYKVNIDSEEELSDRYDITTLPTIIIFKDGKEIGRKMGLQTMESLEEMIPSGS